RWSTIVFESTDLEEEWDGSYNGRTLPNGQYTFVVKFVDCEYQTEFVTGKVNIIR
ncbi:MAG: gliding motility-associated C-terminal domain-containing protein, partial [Flavobacteriales bacterium]|nr:gliding motility-associated C-terminal domain-containing protein [Flavobacteriales bacterium]